MTMTAAPDAGFDPGAITEELLDSLTSARLRAVLAYYKLPDPPKGTAKAALLTWARVAVRAHMPVGEIDAPIAEHVSGDAGPAVADPVALEPVPAQVIPEASRWQQLVAMGEYLARASLTPKALQNKPHDVTSILLAANDLGVPITQALHKLYVVHGRVGMAAELMIALVLRDGHTIIPDPDNDREHATAHCRRRDSDERVSVTFTIDEALDAGLCTRDRDGEIRARSKDGGKGPWETYTADMLWARAVSRACRRVFPDSLAGVSYTPDELGYIDADPVDEPRRRRDEPTVSLDAQRSEIAARIADLDDDLKSELREEWKRRGLPGPVDLRPAAIRTALGLLEPVEARQAERRAASAADIDDADVVDDDAVTSESGSAGEPEGTLGDVEHSLPPAEASPGAASPVDPTVDTDTDDYCAECGERFADDAAIVFGDDLRPYHAEHSPFLGRGES